MSRLPVAVWSAVISLSFDVIWPCKCPEAVATSSTAPWAIPDTVVTSDVFCVTLVSRFPVAVCKVLMSLSLAVICACKFPLTVST